MLCPTCGIALRHIQQDGAGVDLCLKCRGVWLKRGEMETLVEREASELALAFREADNESDSYFLNSGSRSGSRSGSNVDASAASVAPPPKKRKGILERLSELCEAA